MFTTIVIPCTSFLPVTLAVPRFVERAVPPEVIDQRVLGREGLHATQVAPLHAAVAHLVAGDALLHEGAAFWARHPHGLGRVGEDPVEVLPAQVDADLVIPEQRSKVPVELSAPTVKVRTLALLAGAVAVPAGFGVALHAPDVDVGAVLVLWPHRHRNHVVAIVAVASEHLGRGDLGDVCLQLLPLVRGEKGLGVLVDLALVPAIGEEAAHGG